MPTSGEGVSLHLPSLPLPLLWHSSVDGMEPGQVGTAPAPSPALLGELSLNVSWVSTRLLCDRTHTIFRL